MEEYTPGKVRGLPEMRGMRENMAPCENRPPDGEGGQEKFCAAACRGEALERQGVIPDRGGGKTR